MPRTKLIDYNLEFNSLTNRDVTDKIIIHHTGNPNDDDLSARMIHQSHKNIGWAGIGYHYVVRKSGDVEKGRPDDCMGAHAEGENDSTIGVHLCGNFELAIPTKEQIEATARLIADIADKYNINICPQTVIGHRELMPTVCPGHNLYNMMDIVVGKAIWYQQNT